MHTVDLLEYIWQDKLSAKLQAKFFRESMIKGTIGELVWKVTRTRKLLSFFVVSSKKKSLTGTSRSFIEEGKN